MHSCRTASHDLFFFSGQKALKYTRIYSRMLVRFTSSAEVCCPSGFFCSRITCVRIMWELQLKHKLSWHTLHIVEAKTLGLSCVETTNKGLLDGFGSEGTIKDEVPTWAPVTMENFIRCWAQKDCELLHNMCWKRGWLCWEMIHFSLVTECCTQSN